MTTAAERAFSTAANAQSFPAKAPDGTAKCPSGLIRIGIFFDGTNNNAHRDWPPPRDTGQLPEKAENGPTNVIKLYELFIDDKTFQRRFYHHGVGSGSETTKAGEKHRLNSLFGGGFGAGGENRVEWGLKMVHDFFNQEPHYLAEQKCVDVYGFSRGAAIARDFVNRLRLVGIDNKHKQDGYRYVPTGPRSPPARVPQYDRFRDMVLEFLGVFDTVASFGLGGLSAGNAIAGYNFFVDGTTPGPGNSVLKTVHFIAEDEIRGNFPLESIDQEPEKAKNNPLPPNMIERPYPGAHSDVGGGYLYEPAKPEGPPKVVTDGWSAIQIPGDPAVPEKFPDLAKIPLRDMHEESTTKGGGVPLNPLKNLPENLWKAPPKLDELYQQYLTERPGLAKKAGGTLGKDYIQGLPKDQYRPLYYDTRSGLKSWQALHENYIHDSRWGIDKFLDRKQRTVHYMGPQKKK